MAIGERIKRIRKELELSQKEFATRIGISDNYLSEIESGKKSPSVPTLLAIEYRFGISSEWLQGGKKNKHVKEGISLTGKEVEVIHLLRENKEIQNLVDLLSKQFRNRSNVVKKLVEFLKTI